MSFSIVYENESTAQYLYPVEKQKSVNHIHEYRKVGYTLTNRGCAWRLTQIVALIATIFPGCLFYGIKATLKSAKRTFRSITNGQEVTKHYVRSFKESSDFYTAGIAKIASYIATKDLPNKIHSAKLVAVARFSDASLLVKEAIISSPEGACITKDDLIASIKQVAAGQIGPSMLSQKSTVEQVNQVILIKEAGDESSFSWVRGAQDERASSSGHANKLDEKGMQEVFSSFAKIAGLLQFKNGVFTLCYQESLQ